MPMKNAGMWVPSAPGKRFKEDDKITDLLYHCYDLATTGKNIDVAFEPIRTRYTQIVQQLGLSYDIAPELDEVYRNLASGAKRDYAGSRGEYLNGLIMAAALGWDFVDAAEVIRFNEKGVFDAEETNRLMSERLSKHRNARDPRLLRQPCGRQHQDLFPRRFGHYRLHCGARR